MEDDKKVGFLEENPGESSMMRLVSLLCVLVVMIIWAIVCITKKDMIDIPPGPLWVVGMGIGGKLAQKLVESGVVSALAYKIVNK